MATEDSFQRYKNQSETAWDGKNGFLQTFLNFNEFYGI
jgi:hypothetical protein